VAYGEVKEELVELLDAAFGSARVAYRALMADLAELERLLAAGAEGARGRAAPVIDRVRSAVGLGQPPAGTPDDRLAQVS
jgi:tryptophanyl-tRNA synthetase